jgi:hypothetical protein
MHAHAACIDQIAPRRQHSSSDDVPRAHARAAATVYVWGSSIKSNACGACYMHGSIASSQWPACVLPR